MRIVVFDRELHEPLTIVNIPAGLMPRPDASSSFMPRVIMFEVEDPEIGYRTPIVPMDRPTRLITRRTTITLEPVCRTVGTNPGNHRSELLFWYAYADDPELALLLRAAFLPGQVGEMQMRQKEAEAKGILRGFGIAMGMQDPDDLF